MWGCGERCVEVFHTSPHTFPYFPSPLLNPNTLISPHPYTSPLIFPTPSTLTLRTLSLAPPPHFSTFPHLRHASPHSPHTLSHISPPHFPHLTHFSTRHTFSHISLYLPPHPNILFHTSPHTPILSPYLPLHLTPLFTSALTSPTPEHTSPHSPRTLSHTSFHHRWVVPRYLFSTGTVGTLEKVPVPKCRYFFSQFLGGTRYFCKIFYNKKGEGCAATPSAAIL